MFGAFVEKIVDLLFPYRCLKCGKILDSAGYLCEDCVGEINFIKPPYCQKCGSPLHIADNDSPKLCGICSQNKKSFYRLARSAMVYDNSDKNLIIAFKFFDKTENAKLLAAMLKIAGKDIFDTGVDVIIPVPLHYTRLIKRRYNQSVLLADKLGHMINVPVDRFSLIRHRKTRPQVEFSGRERITNVKDAFSVKYPDKIRNRRIVLIDDVMTTGSTLKECAAALHKSGAKSIDVLTVARVVD